MTEYLLKLEMSLWIEETRNNKEYLNMVLHPDFVEYGSSGKTYTKEIMINAGDVVINAVFPFPNLKVKQLENNTFMITYTSVQKLDNTFRKSNRCSIWVGNDKTFQLIHHQGTITV